MSLSPVSRKEARELAPYFIGAVATLLVISVTMQENATTAAVVVRIISIAVLYIATCLLAVWPISSEFEHGTMARLLAQPVSRVSIWRQKFGWSSRSIGFLLLLGLVATAVVSKYELVAFGTTAFVLIIHAATTLASGAFMAVYLRQTLTAVLATMIVPHCCLVVSALLGEIVRTQTGINFFSDKYELIDNISVMYAAPLLLWTVVAYYLARRRFLNLEV